MNESETWTLGDVPVGLTYACDPRMTVELRQLYAHARCVAGAASAPRCSLTIAQEQAEHAVPSSPDFVLAGSRPLWGKVENHTLRITDGASSARIDYGAGTARLSVDTPNGPRDLEQRRSIEYTATHRLFPLALGELLRAQGVIYMHAAAVCLGDRGLLMLADSETGKSTLCYRALCRGWSVVADDGLLLRHEGEHIVASPFYREFAVHPALVRPEHTSLTTPSTPMPGEPRVRFDLPARSSADSTRVNAVALLQRNGNSVSGCRPCTSSQVMVEAVRQNAFVSLYEPLAGAHLALLAALTRVGATTIISLGTDVLDSDAAIDSLLERATARA